MPTRRCDKSRGRGGDLPGRGPPSFFPITGKYPRPLRVSRVGNLCICVRLPFVPAKRAHARTRAGALFPIGPAETTGEYSQFAGLYEWLKLRMEGPARNKGRETEPFPRRVCHLQRKLNDSAQFARTRSVRRVFATPCFSPSPPASPSVSSPLSPLRVLLLASCMRQGRRRHLAPRGRLRRPTPSVKILECETREKLPAR